MTSRTSLMILRRSTACVLLTFLYLLIKNLIKVDKVIDIQVMIIRDNTAIISLRSDSLKFPITKFGKFKRLMISALASEDCMANKVASIKVFIRPKNVSSKSAITIFKIVTMVKKIATSSMKIIFNSSKSAPYIIPHNKKIINIYLI